LPSEIIAAFLYAQLESLGRIQEKRINLWNLYNHNLTPLQDKGFVKLPRIPDYATNNAHMFYIVCNNLDERTGLINHLKRNDILAVFHYLSLHKSPYQERKFGKHELELINSDKFTDCLLRLPLYYELTPEEVNLICKTIEQYYH
jgi:dTDP-4-amino-4,6-dideoxygalactose transaminase